MRYSTAHYKRDVDFKVAKLDGGLNYALPPHDIAPTELYEALNFFYDSETGRLATRPGLVAETNTAIDPADMQLFAVTAGGTRYIVAASSSKLYKLSSASLSLIGSLASSSVPTFTAFNNKLYIASGGTLQKWDGTTLTSNVTSHSCTIVVAKDGRLFTNDTSDDDMVWVSGPLLDSEWGFPGGAQFQAGFSDGDGIIAMIPFGHDLIIAKGSKQRSLFVLKGVYPNWQMEELARGTTTLSQHSYTKAQKDVLLLDVDGLNSLAGVMEYGDLKVDPLGGPVAGYLTAELDSTGYIVQWPSQAVALVFPNKTASLAYVLHYSLSADVPRFRWTRFLFEVGRLTSAVYDVTADKIYFGCYDGKIYSLSKLAGSTVYTDDGSAYNQRIATKIFDMPEHLLLFKGADFRYESLADGAGTLSLIYDDANTQVDLKTFTSTKLVVDDWLTPVIGDMDFPSLATPQASATVRTNKRLRVKNLQIGINMTSGGISISRMAIRAAAVGRG